MYFYVVLRKGKELEMGGRKKKKKNVQNGQDVFRNIERNIKYLKK